MMKVCGANIIKERNEMDRDIDKKRVAGQDVDYTKEDNKAALLAQIDEIEQAYKDGDISFKDKSAQISAIRFRLQDKFELEKSGDERRIIVVPAKHLYVCPHTNRECSSMPPKEVCMKYHNLVERKDLERLQEELDKLRKGVKD